MEREPENTRHVLHLPKANVAAIYVKRDNLKTLFGGD
jgi:hypothetical protein